MILADIRGALLKEKVVVSKINLLSNPTRPEVDIIGNKGCHPVQFVMRELTSLMLEPELRRLKPTSDMVELTIEMFDNMTLISTGCV